MRHASKPVAEARPFAIASANWFLLRGMPAPQPLEAWAASVTLHLFALEIDSEQVTIDCSLATPASFDVASPAQPA